MKKKLMNITVYAVGLFMFHCTTMMGSLSIHQASKNQPGGMPSSIANLIPANVPTNKNYEGQTLQDRECRFSNQDLRGVNFKHATLINCRFKGSFFDESTKFTDAQVSEGLFTDAIFFKTDLSETSFSASRFRRAKFYRVRLAGTKFLGKEVTRTLGATVETEVLKTQMQNTQFLQIAIESTDDNSTTFQDVILHSAAFIDAHFLSPTFSRVRARNATFTKSTFKNADWKGINVSDSSFWLVNLIGAKLRKAKFRNTTITESTLQDANAQDTDFTASTFDETDLISSDFRNSDLNLVDFGTSDLENFQLQGADLKWAKLHLTQNFQSIYKTADGQARPGHPFKEVKINQYTKFPSNIPTVERLKFIFGREGVVYMSEKKSDVQCVFERPFIMGASISSGFSDNTRYIGTYGGTSVADLAKWVNLDLGTDVDSVMSVTSEFIRANRYAAQGVSYHGSDKKYDSPTTQVARRTSVDPQITNIAEMIGDLPRQQRAYRQLEAVLNLNPTITQKVEENVALTEAEAFALRRQKKYLKRLENATVLASIDGFYWPSTETDCSDQMTELLDGIDLIIDTGKKLNIPVMLGTIPGYDASMMHSTVLDLINRYAGGIKFPQTACYTRINDYKKQNCTMENGCYLLDIHQLVDTYKDRNTDGTVKTLNFNDVKVTFNIPQNGSIPADVYPVRSRDGLHLSPTGSRYVGKLVEDLFLKGLQNPNARYLPRQGTFPCSPKPVDLSDPAKYKALYTLEKIDLFTESLISLRDEIDLVSLTPLPIQVDLKNFIIATLGIGL